DRGRSIQLGCVGTLERELIGASASTLPAKIDGRLIHHEDADAGHLRKLRPQVGHDLIDRAFALGPRLQVDADAALVCGTASAAAAHADVAVESRDVRIFRDDVRHFELVTNKVVETDALAALDRYLEAALILGGQEP